MSQEIGLNGSNPFQNATDSIHFTNIEGLKSTLDDIDVLNIRTSFKMAKDPIYLAFDHIDKQPLKKAAKDFVRDLSDGFVEFVTSLPSLFSGSTQEEEA